MSDDMGYTIKDTTRAGVCNRIRECADMIREVIEDYGITSAIIGLAIQTNDEGDCESFNGCAGNPQHVNQLIALQMDLFNERYGETP
jgi:hypothetical protein